MPRSPSINRLSIIAEDGPSEPYGGRHSGSVKPSHRPFDRRWRDNPPSHDSEQSPPDYMLGEIGKSKAEALRRLRSNRQIARRGGWRRAILILLILLAICVALGVGIGVGVTRNRGNGSSGSSPNPSPTPQPFPAGAYAVSTYLTTIDANCTTQTSTWRCFPYTTYSPGSGSAAAVTFNWIINATASSPTSSSSPAAAPQPSSSSSTASFMISSSDNPFAISFSNISLQLLDLGRPSERYTFSVPMDAYVVPSSPITSDNTAAACWYNGTRFEGSLYTRATANANASSMSTMSSAAPMPTSTPSNGWSSWPGAVNVTQSIPGGNNVPNCYQLTDGVLGAPVTQGLGPKPASEVCACQWRNYML